eukprot:2092265-Lingulodinium_polyedra.AAC.1
MDGESCQAEFKSYQALAARATKHHCIIDRIAAATVTNQRVFCVSTFLSRWDASRHVRAASAGDGVWHVDRPRWSAQVRDPPDFTCPLCADRFPE